MSDVGLLLRAARFAADKHRDQRRKGRRASPYINHPLEVADLLARVGGVDDPVTLVAGVLHDTVEDTRTTFEEIEANFGPEVRGVVAELTDDKSLPKAVRKRLQVEHAPHASRRAKLVKLGDKICNVLDVTNDPPADWATERRREYLEWAREVVEGLRGANAALERCFDAVWERGMGVIAGEEKAGAP